MVDFVTARRLFYWCILSLISASYLFVLILPLDLSAGRLPGPDIIVAIGFAWVLRRPNFVPVALFAAIVFASDILLQKPPGVWAALSVIGLEFMRRRAQFSREMPFLVEWVLLAAVLIAMFAANRMLLAVFVVGQPSFLMDAARLLFTIAAYPIVAFLSANLLGVRHIIPGEVDELGREI